MNVALIGHGNMGKEIALLAPSRNIRIEKIFDDVNPVSAPALEGIEMCIDVSAAAAVLQNVTAAAQSGVNIVVGTTGWEAQREQVINTVRANKTGILIASNFSIGVNLFFRIVAEAARLMNGMTAYDAAIHEVHHKGKKDSPSGTALTLAQILCRHLDRKREVLAGSPEGAIKPEQLQVTSGRLGSVVGTHTVSFDSEADTITLTHTAKNRSGFALGALLAAEWLRGKQGIYTMDDVLTT